MYTDKKWRGATLCINFVALIQKRRKSLLNKFSKMSNNEHIFRTQNYRSNYLEHFTFYLHRCSQTIQTYRTRYLPQIVTRISESINIFVNKNCNV